MDKDKIEGFQPSEFCRICGDCCKHLGCEYSPDDFNDLSFDGLQEEIDKGFISIDWWEGHPENISWRGKTYFLRARNKRAPIVDPSWGGECKLLGKDGCKLSFEERPKGGRMLKPKSCDEEECVSFYGKKASAIDWLKHQDTLKRLVGYYT